MLATIVDIMNLDNGYDDIGVEEIHTKDYYDYTVPTGTCDHLLGKTVSININVSEIVNADFDHVYPEGTIGS